MASRLLHHCASGTELSQGIWPGRCRPPGRQLSSWPSFPGDGCIPAEAGHRASGACILQVLILQPESGCAYSGLHTLSHLLLSPGKAVFGERGSSRWMCHMAGSLLPTTTWSCQQVGKLFSRSRQGPALTYDHVLQRVLGQPAVEKHGDEQVPKRRPEDLWCVGERSGGAWVAELGAGAHPP